MSHLEPRIAGCAAAPVRLIAALAASLLLGACSQLGDGPEPPMLTTSAAGEAGNQAMGPRSELERATDYWGKQYAKNPRDLDTALSYAANLRALGQNRRALAVLQQAAVYGGNNKKFASEYGRLALELDQVSLAKQLLEVADDPASPDWRVISARGTVLAKQGEYKEAITLYERALTLAPDHPSVLSNLALAHAMSGEADKAEPLLRRAAQSKASDPKVRQNLALVLGLQGKYDEATRVAAQDIPRDVATANTDYVRRLVQLEAKPDAGVPPPVAVAQVSPQPAMAEKPSRTAVAPWSMQVSPEQPAPQLKPSTQETETPSAPWTAHVATTW